MHDSSRTPRDSLFDGMHLIMLASRLVAIAGAVLTCLLVRLSARMPPDAGHGG